MDLYHIGENCTHIIAISNSGNLAADFYKYGCSFYDAAEQVIHYLCNEAAEKHDIAKLDLWYFATVYLYRQSLELLLKANIFQTVMNGSDRKKLVGKIRHNLRQSFEQLIALRNLSIDENENGKWLMAYLSDISRLDEESDMFRYPFGSKFKTLFKKQTHISLVATHNNMNKAYKIIKELFDTGNLSEQTYESSLPQLSTLNFVKKYILAFHNSDQRSDLFRYPCSKDLDSYFLTEKKFDIDNVASCFEELCNFLDATDDMLGTIKDCESEAVAEATRYSDYYNKLYMSF